MASPMESVSGFPENNPGSEFVRLEGDSAALSAAGEVVPQAGAEEVNVIPAASLAVGQPDVEDPSPIEKMSGNSVQSVQEPRQAGAESGSDALPDPSSKEKGIRPSQPELGHAAASAPAEVDWLSRDAVDVPDSVKAWYAMPIGPPVKPAKRSSRRGAQRTASFIDDSGPIGSTEPPVTKPDHGIARPPLSDGSLLQRNASTAIWRLAGLTAVAAAAGAVFVTNRPHNSRSVPFLVSSSQPSKLPLLSDAGRATRSSAPPLIAAIAASSVIGNAVGPSLAGGIPMPGQLKAKTAERNFAAATAPGTSSSGRATGKPGQRSDSLSRRRLEERQYSASNYGDRNPCEDQKGSSHRVADSLTSPQRPAVSRFLRTIGRHLLRLTGRKSRIG